MLVDELGPEAIIRVHDPKTGMKGVLVIDNTTTGPAGGGIRMAPDVTEDDATELLLGPGLRIEHGASALHR